MPVVFSTYDVSQVALGNQLAAAHHNQSPPGYAVNLPAVLVRGARHLLESPSLNPPQNPCRVRDSAEENKDIVPEQRYDDAHLGPNGLDIVEIFRRNSVL